MGSAGWLLPVVGGLSALLILLAICLRIVAEAERRNRPRPRGRMTRSRKRRLAVYAASELAQAALLMTHRKRRQARSEQWHEQWQEALIQARGRTTTEHDTKPTRNDL